MKYSLQQLSDIECTRDCASRYCRELDRLDEVLMKSSYWPDAIDDAIRRLAMTAFRCKYLKLLEFLSVASLLVEYYANTTYHLEMIHLG